MTACGCPHPDAIACAGTAWGAWVVEYDSDPEETPAPPDAPDPYCGCIGCHGDQLEEAANFGTALVVLAGGDEIIGECFECRAVLRESDDWESDREDNEVCYCTPCADRLEADAQRERAMWPPDGCPF